MAAVQTVDFREIDEKNAPLPVRPMRAKNGRAKSMSPKQLRARARRNRRDAEAAMNVLYKPVEEWDDEELARGRPRGADGTFRGSAPEWVSRAMHEEAVARFQAIVRGRLQAKTPAAIELIGQIVESEERDDDGKSLVPYPTKLSAATFLVEHVIGKPKQRMESEISVKLQGLLATAVVVPGQLPAAAGAADRAGVPGGDDFVDAEGEEVLPWAT